MNAALQTPGSGIEISLRLGQRVRRDDFKGQRITGVIRGLSIDGDHVLQADIVLDAPIVLPARSAADREISIWNQHIPAHELSPFDERDEFIDEVLVELRHVVRWHDQLQPHDIARLKTLIAKATGSAT